MSGPNRVGDSDATQTASSTGGSLSIGGKPETGPSATGSKNRGATISGTETSAPTGIRTIKSQACGRYTLIAAIGKGGMGGVYLGVRSGAGGFRKLVVIKKIHAHLAEDQRFVTMFMDEARLAARMNHPNLVQTFEVGRDNEKIPFMAMEYMEGESFSQLIKEQLRKRALLDESLVINVVYHALSGLHYAHELEGFDGGKLNVVHRDISPSNIFVTKEGIPKVLDFGIAKAADSETTTRVGEIKGKYAYMSPEQAAGGFDLDRRADIWAMGITLFSALSGKHAFRAKSDVETIDRVMRYSVEKRLDEIGDRISDGMKVIIGRCLERDIEKRYSTAAEVRDALEEYAAENKIKLSQGPLAEHITQSFGDEMSERKRAVAAIVDDFEDATHGGGHTETGWTDVEAPKFSQEMTPASVVSQRGVPWWGLMLFGVVMLGAVFATIRYAIPAQVPAVEQGGGQDTASTIAPLTPTDSTESAGLETKTEGEKNARPDASVRLDAALEPSDNRRVKVPADKNTLDRLRRERAKRRKEAEARAKAEAEARAAAAAKAAAAKAAAAEAARPKGAIILAASPWAEVYYKGKKIGQTPGKFSLPEGTHQLKLSNPDSGINRTVNVVIVAGKTQRKRISLQ